MVIYSQPPVSFFSFYVFFSVFGLICLQLALPESAFLCPDRFYYVFETCADQIHPKYKIFLRFGAKTRTFLPNYFRDYESLFQRKWTTQKPVNNCSRLMLLWFFFLFSVFSSHPNIFERETGVSCPCDVVMCSLKSFFSVGINKISIVAVQSFGLLFKNPYGIII